MALSQYDWIIALLTIAFCASAFGNGANDVANSYATSVAARTLTMVQVGFLSICTEFVGAVALGARVTNTIKNNIIDIKRFESDPAVLILAMACAETASATWLLVATKIGFPVSTTQTIVGALIGVAFASQASVKWGWSSGSVSQVAASWAIAPLIAGCFAAIIFGTVKYSVLERRESLKWGMRLIPGYLAVTAAILALFIIVEAPTAPSLEEFGAGKAIGIVSGVLFGSLIIAYVFFHPYFHRRLILNDSRLKAYHILLGPTLWKKDPWIPFPAPAGREAVINYGSTHQEIERDPFEVTSATMPRDMEKESADVHTKAVVVRRSKKPEPEERFLEPTKHLPISHPARLWSWSKYLLLQGVTRDCVTFNSKELASTHDKAIVYDNRVEHLWTYAQVASAMLMSIAHGSNDVSNAVGPMSAAYSTWERGSVSTTAPTPTWMLAVAGILLGLGFWFFGYHIVRALGNRITKMSPTRGFSVELGAAVTVLLASRLSLPVSTTQCLAGATCGVALMNYSVGAVNWKQMGWIFTGWFLTLPCAGLISGLLMVMALNTPHF